MANGMEFEKGKQPKINDSEDTLKSRVNNLEMAIDSIGGRVVILNSDGHSLWVSSQVAQDFANSLKNKSVFDLRSYVVELEDEIQFQSNLTLVKEKGSLTQRVRVNTRDISNNLMMKMTFNNHANYEEIIVSFYDENTEDLDCDTIEKLVLPLSKLHEDIGKLSPLVLATENIHLAILTIRNISDISFIRGEKHVDKIFESYAKLIRPKFSSKVKFYRVSEFELGVIIETSLDAQEVLVRLKHFIILVDSNIDVDGHSYHLKIHAGISTLGMNESIESLIRNASFAKDVATSDNKPIEVYSLDDVVKHIEDITMADLFQYALYNNGLHMEYQPIVSKDNMIWGYESLVRWKDQQYGDISAIKIIEYAERRGSMVRLGYWIVRRVFEDIHKVKEETNSNLIVTINLSLEQFQDPLLAKTLYDLSQEYKVDPKYVMFEITESHAFSNLEFIRNVLVELSGYGFLIALDDFGVGYSTIMNLVDLPISLLKLDKSLLKNIKTNKKSVVVCESIVSLAHKLGLHIIAEGIETVSDEEVMLDFRVSLLQGYYYYLPLQLDILIDSIKESICLKA